jgi:hypothetical protein
MASRGEVLGIPNICQWEREGGKWDMGANKAALRAKVLRAALVMNSSAIRR